MATMVLSALPCAPRVGETYASRLLTLTVKSRMCSTVSAGMPGPLSAILIPVLSTVTAIDGAIPASSQESTPLSPSSLKMTSGHASRR